MHVMSIVAYKDIEMFDDMKKIHACHDFCNI